MADRGKGQGTRIASIACLLFLGACANPRTASPDDPFEPMNRVFFAINHKVDRYAAQPAATTYRDLFPDPLRTGIHNFIANLNEPVTIANCVLQGHFHQAGISVARFGLNTTIGVVGVLDVASKRGLWAHKEDFGQTLGVYGVPSGPYLVLPFLGSETPRDLGGRFVDSFFEPTRYIAYEGKPWVSLGLSGLNMLDQRSESLGVLRDIERSSVDFYATTRSIYLQRRRNAIDEGNPAPGDLPDY
jgi:phospholipid-binding lipoprotein MlaA